VSGLAGWRVEDKVYVWDGGRLAPMWQELGGHAVRGVGEVWGVPNV
jgi:hypothetical protein